MSDSLWSVKLAVPSSFLSVSGVSSFFGLAEVSDTGCNVKESGKVTKKSRDFVCQDTHKAKSSGADGGFFSLSSSVTDSSQKAGTAGSSMLVLVSTLALLLGGPITGPEPARVRGTSSLRLHKARRVGNARINFPRRRRRSHSLSIVEDDSSDEEVEDDVLQIPKVHLSEVMVSFDESLLFGSPIEGNSQFITPEVSFSFAPCKGQRGDFLAMVSFPLTWNPIKRQPRNSPAVLLLKDCVGEDVCDSKMKKVVCDSKVKKVEANQPDVEPGFAHLSPSFHNADELLAAANFAFRREGFRFAKLSTDCTGGVYIIKDKQDANVAVWKPADEEDIGRTDSEKEDGPLRQGLAAGDGYLREEAAYLLDARNGGHAGVPPTLSVAATQTNNGKVVNGSLQQYFSHECSADDMGSSKFGVENVHQIGLLDLRLFNLDRHGGNILVDRANKLIPIDHGLCLPPIDSLGEAEFTWLYWRQAKKPFSAKTAKWVANLSADRDAAMLQELGVGEDAVATARLCTLVLQRCVAAGMNLFEIGSMFVRKGLGEMPSDLEALLVQARISASVDAPDFVSHAAALLDERFQLNPREQT
jgi:hypothetical protein